MSIYLMGLLPSLLVKSTLVLVAVFIVLHLLKRFSSAEKHLVWSVTFCSLLLLPVLVLVMPKYEVNLPSFDFLNPLQINLDDVNKPTIDAAITALANDGNTLNYYFAKIKSINPLFAIVTVYLLVALALLLRTVFIYSSIGRSVAKLEKMHATELERTLTVLQQQLGIRRSIELLVSKKEITPWTWGVVRPKVVLPRGFREWTAADQHNALVHELAHIGRFDVISFLLARLCCSVYWFHPLVWRAYLNMTVEAEKACDDQVILSGSQASSYATQLTQVASSVFHNHDNKQHDLIAAMARRSSLSIRIKGILMANVRRNPITAKSFIAALCLVSVVTIPLVSAQTSQGSTASAEAKRTSEPTLNEPTALKLKEVIELMQGEKFDDALKQLDQMVTEGGLNSRERASVENFYGYVYYTLEDHDQAIQHYQNVLGFEGIPQDMIETTTRTVAQLYLMQNNYSKAVEYYERFIAAEDTPDPNDYFHLAQAYYMNGDQQKSISLLEQTYQLYLAKNEMPKKAMLDLLRGLYYEQNDEQNFNKYRDLLWQYYPETRDQYKGEMGQKSEIVIKKQ